MNAIKYGNRISRLRIDKWGIKDKCEILCQK